MKIIKNARNVISSHVEALNFLFITAYCFFVTEPAFATAISSAKKLTKNTQKLGKETIALAFIIAGALYMFGDGSAKDKLRNSAIGAIIILGAPQIKTWFGTSI